jgi:hypothetical protein
MTVNKHTTKVVQDGVELTWHQEGDGDAKPEDVAKFYVDSVKALQTFKDEDPRTQPALRKQAKARKEFRNTLWWLVFLGLGLVGAYQAGKQQHHSSPWNDYRH